MHNKVIRYSKAGLGDSQIAELLGIEAKTLWNWDRKNPKFLQARKEAKGIKDGAVVRSLYERATGYEVPEDKVFVHNGVPIVVPTIKRYPPDSVAMIFWLKNRQPGQWRDKQEHEHSFKDYKVSLPDANDQS